MSGNSWIVLGGIATLLVYFCKKLRNRGNSWIVFGGLAVFAAIAIPYGFHLKSKSKATTKIGDIKVEQKGNTLLNVVGTEISNSTTDVEIGKVNVNQEGKNLENVTGVRIGLDSNSGEIELKDKMGMKQNKISLTINADQPGVNVRFNKKPTMMETSNNPLTTE